MLRDRLLTAAVAIPALFAMILAGPPWVFIGFVAILGVIGLLEYATMAFPSRLGERGLIALAGSVTLVAGCFFGSAAVVAGLMATTIAGLTWVLLGREDFEQGLRDLGIAMVGIVYLAVLVPHFPWLHVSENGPQLVLFVIAVGMAGDTAGYFAGRQFGSRKLMPRVSPGKTIEGAVGIMFGSVLGAAVARWFWLDGWSWAKLVSFALAMGVLGQIGDLTESVMKRTFGTKESGWLFPGHGGVLDRIDSLLFPVALVYYHSWLPF